MPSGKSHLSNGKPAFGAIGLQQAQSCTIKGNKIYNAGSTTTSGTVAVVLSGAGLNNSYIGNYINHTDRQGVQLRGFCIGNIATNVEESPIITDNEIIDTKHTAIAGEMNNPYIARNRVRDCGYGGPTKAGGASVKNAYRNYGVPMENDRGAVIENNDFEHCAQGIQLEGVNNVTIRGNRIANMTSAGIYTSGGASDGQTPPPPTITAKDTLITGNTFISCLNGAVDINDGDSYTISNNKIYSDPQYGSPSYYGLRIAPAWTQYPVTNVRITENDIHDLGEGIRISDSWAPGSKIENVAVQANSITNISGYGIQIHEAVNGNVTSISARGNCFSNIMGGSIETQEAIL